jgi:hypothetical protein
VTLGAHLRRRVRALESYLRLGLSNRHAHSRKPREDRDHDGAPIDGPSERDLAYRGARWTIKKLRAARSRLAEYEAMERVAKELAR